MMCNLLKVKLYTTFCAKNYALLTVLNSYTLIISNWMF